MQSTKSFIVESLQEKLVSRNEYLLRKYHYGSPHIKEEDQPSSSGRPTQSPQQQFHRGIRTRQIPVSFKSPSPEEKVTHYLNRLADPSIPYGLLSSDQQPASNQKHQVKNPHQLLDMYLSASRNQEHENVRNSDDNIGT